MERRRDVTTAVDGDGARGKTIPSAVIVNGFERARRCVGEDIGRNIQGNVTVQQALDPSFVQAALKELGPYKPKVPR